MVNVPLGPTNTPLADFAKKVERDIVDACIRNGKAWDGTIKFSEEINAYLSALAVAMITLEETTKIPYGTVEGFIAAAREHRRQK